MRRSILAAAASIVILGGACTTTSNAPTTTEPVPLATVALGTEGLGDVLFGLDPDTVVTDLTARFGAPDSDSGWIPATPNIYGMCPGETMRAIGWGSLVTIFIDDGLSDLGGWFFTYTYGYDYAENIGGVDPRALNLRTDRGVGIGSTVEDLEDAWQADLTIAGDAELDLWTFAAPEAGFKGLLSGPDPADVVTLLEPTEGCS